MMTGSVKSMLLAWFDLNKTDPTARQYTFDEIPLYYKYEKEPTGRWRR